MKLKNTFHLNFFQKTKFRPKSLRPNHYVLKLRARKFLASFTHFFSVELDVWYGMCGVGCVVFDVWYWEKKRIKHYEFLFPMHFIPSYCKLKQITSTEHEMLHIKRQQK